MAGTIAITMAGMGSRFRSAGYTCPKYQIEVGGHYLFDWSMLGLVEFSKAGWEFWFATLAQDHSIDFIKERCAALQIQLGGIIELDSLTDGQATTAVCLAERAAPALPFAVFNIDTFVSPGAMSPAQIPEGAQGWIPCFPGVGDGWSFARTDQDGKVVELREKLRISDHATTGFYYFASAQLYLETYRRYFLAGKGEEMGERYIAPMYNQLIEGDKLVRIQELTLDDVGMLGTPEQVSGFSAHPPKSALPYFKA